MSIKESIRRRTLRNHGYVSAGCICSENETQEKNIKAAENRKQNIISPEATRRSLLQYLDTADLSTKVNAIKTHISFLNLTVMCFTNEYNNLQVKDKKALNNLLFNYKSHIKKLLIFDDAYQFNNTTYTKNLAEIFATEIIKLNPKFLHLLQPKTQSNTL